MGCEGDAARVAFVVSKHAGGVYPHSQPHNVLLEEKGFGGVRVTFFQCAPYSPFAVALFLALSTAKMATNRTC